MSESGDEAQTSATNSARASTEGLTLGSGQSPAQGSDFLYDQRLRKLERLTKRAQFLHTQRRGRRYHGDAMVVYVYPNELAYSRLGITTSRKVGNAVRRNRWRRLLREAFRCHKATLPVGFDVVVIIKPDQVPGSAQVVSAELIRCARKASRHFTAV